MQEGTALLGKGRISVRDEKSPQIMCDFLQPLASVGESPYSGGPATLDRPADRPGVIADKSRLYLRVPSISDPSVAYLRKVLVMFPGKSQLIFYAKDTQKRYGASCLIHTSLVREAREVLGEENVVLK